MNFPARYEIESVKKNYPAGCRVELDYMDDPYRNIPAGTQGTVRVVDDTATIHVSWDCGSSLGIVYGVDKCHKI